MARAKAAMSSASVGDLASSFRQSAGAAPSAARSRPAAAPAIPSSASKILGTMAPAGSTSGNLPASALGNAAAGPRVWNCRVKAGTEAGRAPKRTAISLSPYVSQASHGCQLLNTLAVSLPKSSRLPLTDWNNWSPTARRRLARAA